MRKKWPDVKGYSKACLGTAGTESGVSAVADWAAGEFDISMESFVTELRRAAVWCGVGMAARASGIIVVSRKLK
jgi:hypothetical protein